jgi:hypothetical protein
MKRNGPSSCFWGQVAPRVHMLPEERVRVLRMGAQVPAAALQEQCIPMLPQLRLPARPFQDCQGLGADPQMHHACVCSWHPLVQRVGQCVKEDCVLVLKSVGVHEGVPEGSHLQEKVCAAAGVVRGAGGIPGTCQRGTEVPCWGWCRCCFGQRSQGRYG